MQTTWSFTVDGPLMGAVRTTRYQKFVDPRYKKYAAFKLLIRTIANLHGVPDELDHDKKYIIMIHVYWAKKQRVDLDNILKAATDSLVKQDRRFFGMSIGATEQTGREWMGVTISLANIPK